MTAPSTYRFDSHVNPWHPGLGAYGLGDSATNTAASVLGAASGFAGPAAPFVQLAAVLTSLLGQIFSGCGQTCTLSSSDANQVEAVLKQNLTTYLGGGHTASEQQAALAVVNQAFTALTNACGQASLGAAGQNCISQRLVPTACQWKTSPGGWKCTTCTGTCSNFTPQCNYTYPGAAGSGSTCWNWIVGYYDPIANDPSVVPDPVIPTLATGTTATSTGSATTGTSSLTPILLLAALGLLVILA